VLCPALTSHSEMKPEELRDAGIAPSTIRIAVGDEDPRQLMAHFIRATELILDPSHPGFAKGFMKPADIDALYRRTSLEVHERWLAAQPAMEELLR
jgi:hypothetical protein